MGFITNLFCGAAGAVGANDTMLGAIELSSLMPWPTAVAATVLTSWPACFFPRGEGARVVIGYDSSLVAVLCRFPRHNKLPEDWGWAVDGDRWLYSTSRAVNKRKPLPAPSVATMFC